MVAGGGAGGGGVVMRRIWEEWEQQYCDHLPPHFNDLSLNKTELQHLNSSCSIDKPYQCISNHKAFITSFIWPQEALENIFKVRSLVHRQIISYMESKITYIKIT